MLVSPLPSFLDLCSQSSHSSKVLCIINFLVLWSVCLSSSFFHLKNGSRYLTWRKTAQALIPLMRFLLQRLFSSFLVLPRKSFLVFFFFLFLGFFPPSSLFDGIHFLYSQVLVNLILMHLCYRKKNELSERFRADNGKNRNISERNLSKQTRK